MVSHEEEHRLRESVCEMGRRMYAREMGAANDGNISVRLDEHRLLCTPSGMSLGFLKPEVLCITDFDGNTISAHDDHPRPSSELKLHLRIYRERGDVNAVVHGHPLYATVFAICGRDLDRQIMPEASISLGQVPRAPFALPSTEDLPDSVAKFVHSHDAVLMGNHGAVTFAAELERAYFKMETVEFYAKAIYLAEKLGGINEFDEETLAALIDLRVNRYKPKGRHPFVDGDKTK